MYMGGEVHGEVKDQARKFVTLSNCEIDATKEDQLYAELLQIGLKKFTVKKYLNDRLKVAIYNRARNFTMDKGNKTYLAHFLENPT